MAAKDEPKRLYQVWKGNNKFFFGGRLIFGPDVASLFLSTILIAVPAIAFCTKYYVKIADKDTRHRQYWYPVPIVGSILTILDLLFLFLSSCRDPGIVRRNTRPPDTVEALDVNTPSMEWVDGRTPHLKLPRTKDVMVNGHSVKVKYCDTCLLYRPPRASHCSICNNCVQRFDHHCPWVGQCVGIRNYRFFFMFISTATILCTYVFGFSWINILDRKGSVLKAIRNDVLSDFLIIYTFIAVWFVGGLTVFHFYLICTNQTTYENFRYQYDRKDNPYNRGIIRNNLEIFCSNIPPSMNHFRSFVEEEDESVAVELATPNLEDVVVGSKDLEMGAKVKEGSSYSIPEILQKSEYDDDSGDNSKPKEVKEMPAFDQRFSAEHDAKEYYRGLIMGDESGQSMQSSNAGDRVRESARSLRDSTDGFGGDGMRESGRTSRVSVDSFTGDGSRESARTSRASMRVSSWSSRGSADSFTGDGSREFSRTSRASVEGFFVGDEMRRQHQEHTQRLIAGDGAREQTQRLTTEDGSVRELAPNVTAEDGTRISSSRYSHIANEILPVEERINDSSR